MSLKIKGPVLSEDQIAVINEFKELPNAPKWDGHMPKDITRLLSLEL